MKTRIVSPKPHLFLLCFSILLFLCSCGENNETDGSDHYGNLDISVQITDVRNTAGDTLRTASSSKCEIAGIDSITAVVFNEDDVEVAAGGPWLCSSGKGVITDIKEGTDYKVVVLCLDKTGAVVYRGIQTGLTVKRRKTTQTGAITAVCFKPVLISVPDDYSVESESVLFQWEETPGAAEYRLVISDQSGSAPVVDIVTTQTSYATSTFRNETTYLWKVYAIDAQGNESAPSDTWHFTYYYYGDQNTDLDVYFTDSYNDELNKLIYETLTRQGYNVTIGAGWYEQDGNQSLANYDVVVFLPNEIWSSYEMSDEGQQEIITYVANGGGLVTSEWFVWCIGTTGTFDSLTVLSPAVITTEYRYTSPITYTVSTSHPIISRNLSDEFTFEADDFSGTESFFTPKTGAEVFIMSDYSGSDTTTGAGVIGWQYQSGKVISFSTCMGPSELSNSDYQTLVVNAVQWAGN